MGAWKVKKGEHNYVIQTLTEQLGLLVSTLKNIYLN